jgi:hypothetical protein
LEGYSIYEVIVSNDAFDMWNVVGCGIIDALRRSIELGAILELVFFSFFFVLVLWGRF